MANYILVMDQGTTGSRGVIYDEKGKIVAFDYEEYEQFFPNSGWWEQSGKTVWEVTLKTSRNAIEKAGITGKDIAAIGITNQRETTTIWDKATGEPIYNTIVWGCRRTADICAKLIDEGYNDIVNKKTGLVIDPTYSGSKIRWILDEVEGAQERAEKGELLFGTIDSWLLYNLTKGKVHATDYKNYEGDYSYAGSIFIQPGATFDDSHLIIYGHNMRVKSMFGSLHDFESENFYKKHNKIYLYQPGKTIKCTIYSVYDCLDKSATYLTDFSDDENDNKWVDWLTMTVNNNAYYPIKKKPAEKDRIITLSTCSGKQKGDSYRFVVHSLVTDTVIYEE